MATEPGPPRSGDEPTIESRVDAAAAAIPAALREHDRYRVVGFLGAGGAGQVYRAYDKQLDRVVALKVLATQDAAQAAALLREARAQAHVEHPHVCKVYEIGTINDRPYISMQLIDGPTLSAAAPELTLDEKVRVMRDVAEALHAAHRLGFIHRDVKPANIMLERHDAATPTPYVTDFGLARQLDGDVARTQGLAGTPAYMAPEQARGGAIDRRTDVYGLGATLYAVLSGRPPFETTSMMQLLVQVASHEPPPLRRVAPVPRDLDTVVMKCLEKDPRQRYDSARALAEDLSRYLDGEPVQARRSLVYQAHKKLRKHRLTATLSLLALIAVGAAGWMVGRARLQAQERSRTAQLIGREIARADGILRYAHMLPLHDTRPEKQMVRQRLGEIEALMRTRKSVVPGAVDYVLGRGLLALGEIEPARHALDEAWRAGFHEPDAAWALGRAWGESYRRARAEAEAIEKPDRRRARIAELERSLRDPALKFLEAAAGAQTESADYVAALIASFDRRDDEALALAARAKQAVPWLYEADVLAGDVHLARAADRRLSGDSAGCTRELDAGRAAYEKAVAVGRSDPAVHVALCRLFRGAVQLGVDSGRVPRPDFDRAVAACDAAAVADPDDADAPATKASLLQWVAKQKVIERNTAGELEETIALAKTALSHDPRHVEAWLTLAHAYTLRADAEAADPRAALAGAADALSHALELRNESNAYSELGRVYTMRGAYEQAHGIDRTPSARLAIANFERSIALAPDSPTPLLNLGNIYKDLADDAALRGADPGPAANDAIAAYRRALALNPQYAFAWNGLGTAYHDLASYAVDRGQDPTAPLQQALTAYAKASDANPRFMYPFVNLAEASLLEADWVRAHGGDPATALARAHTAADRAAALSPEYYFVGCKRAQIAVSEAEWARARHRPTAALLDEAARQLVWARAHNPEDPADVMRLQAGVEQKRAEWALADGGDARAALTAGLQFARAALEVNRESADGQSLLGTLELQAAEAGLAPRVEHARAAAAALEEALRRNPSLSVARERLARARQMAAAAAR